MDAPVGSGARQITYNGTYTPTRKRFTGKAVMSGLVSGVGNYRASSDTAAPCGHLPST
jgi:hypothetical protein